jgi:2-iminobutanoate/2-iminopropanoate deaminase
MPTINKMLSPAAGPKPPGPWSSGIEIRPNARYVFTCGIVGNKPDGSYDADDITSQTVCAYTNLLATLAEAGMTMDHVVRLNTYLTNLDDQPAMSKARAPFLGDAHPAMMLLEISRLARPGLLLEIEAVAAKHDQATRAR